MELRITGPYRRLSLQLNSYGRKLKARIQYTNERTNETDNCDCRERGGDECAEKKTASKWSIVLTETQQPEADLQVSDDSNRRR